MAQIVILIVVMGILGGGYSIAQVNYNDKVIKVEKMEQMISQQKQIRLSIQEYCKDNSPIESYPIYEQIPIVQEGYTTKNPFKGDYSLVFKSKSKVGIISEIDPAIKNMYLKTYKTDIFGTNPTCNGVECEQEVFLDIPCETS
jgi:type II secretory pathway pseudopilin PulG